MLLAAQCRSSGGQFWGARFRVSVYVAHQCVDVCDVLAPHQLHLVLEDFGEPGEPQTRDEVCLIDEVVCPEVGGDPVREDLDPATPEADAGIRCYRRSELASPSPGSASGDHVQIANNRPDAVRKEWRAAEDHEVVEIKLERDEAAD
jgi:hypothetical protein